MKRGIAAACLLAAALALPGLGEATNANKNDAAAHEVEKAKWQSRFAAARAAVAQARERHTAAVDAYTKMRHRGNERGDAKRRITVEVSESERALEEAETALKQTFESARRAGVPPGWMRMRRDENPAAPDRPAEDAAGEPRF